MKRFILPISATLLIAAGLAFAALSARGGDAPPQLTTAVVSRGSILSTVSATGTLEAVTTVQVGSEVSGRVDALLADFNSIVRKGQVIARLDPSLYQSAVEQARANLVRAEADRERLRVSAADAAARLERARALAERQLIPASDLDTAEVTLRSLEAQVRSAGAQVQQAAASLKQADVNLAKTVIVSPISGIVVARSVDVGQTVAASMQAPTLFVIAADLSQMQLKASVDESDVGKIAAGQRVTFTVDAYSGDTFAGAVEQVRLSPTVEQNVVTYAAIISAPNASLKLRPGMTANATVEVARREEVLRVPAAALSLRPSADVLKALGAADTPAAGGRATSGVWVEEGTTIRRVNVRAGVTDGTWTEILDGPLADGARVVTRIASPAGAAATASTGSRSPLIAGPPGPPPR